jgi:hypothetical protein
MKQVYSVLFLDSKTKKVLRKFDYPAAKIRSRFFWEKMKAEELSKLTRSRMLEPWEVEIKDISSGI